MERRVARVVWGNFAILFLGLIVQTLIILSATDKDKRFSYFSLRFLMWMSVPYIMMFLVNGFTHATYQAASVVNRTVCILFLINIAMSLYGAASTPIGLAFTGLAPVLGILICTIMSVIAIRKN